MTAESNEHERTMAFAEIALGQIKALHQPALPRNYEVWYHYATGYNPSLNQAINEILSANGNLTQDDIEIIYETYLSPIRLTERIDSIGAKTLDEIKQIITMIDAATGTTARHNENLAGINNQLGQAADQKGLRAIIEGLVNTTREMEQVNQNLESRLHASKQQINELQENLEMVRIESLTDPLTGLANRKYFDQEIESALAKASAKGETLSLIMADIDRFKVFNDTYGHLTGDQVLRLVASSMKQNPTGRNFAARYGGEELAIVLSDTALAHATAVADRIRHAVMSKELIKRSTSENLGRITVSLGGACLRPGDSVQSLIERADACLYAAKHNGRNRVICETDPEISATVQYQVA
jgi:diguanylate cyclase